MKNEEFEATDSRGFTSWDLWAGVIPLVALLPLLFIQAQALWTRPHLQFFPLAVIAAGCFAYGGCRGGESTHPVRRWIAIALLAMAALTYAIGVWKFSPWLGQVAAITAFCAWALGRCGNRSWPTIIAWTGLLATTLPLPLNYDVELIQWLQSVSAAFCSLALDALAVPHLRLANVIQIDGQELFVEEACSGIGSLYALAAFGVLLLIFNGRSFLVSLLALATVPLWAVLGNLIRLLVIVFAQHYYDHDLAHGAVHDLLGLGTFFLAAGCFWLTEQFLATLLRPVPIADAEFALIFSCFNDVLRWPQYDPEQDVEPDDEYERAAYRRMQRVKESRRWKFKPMWWRERPWAVRGVIACGVLMLIAGIAPAVVLARGGIAAISLGLPSIKGEALELFPHEEALPEQIGELRRRGYHREARSLASNFGQNSLIWEYQWDDQMVAISLDFPFDGWHELTVCYRNAGWQIEDSQALVKETNATGSEQETAWPWKEIEMVDELGGYGYVYFCAFNEDLAPVLEVPGSGLGERLTGESGIVRALTGKTSRTIRTTYQIQLFAPTGERLDRHGRNQLREQFMQVRRLVLEAAAPAVESVKRGEL